MKALERIGTPKREMLARIFGPRGDGRSKSTAQPAVFNYSFKSQEQQKQTIRRRIDGRSPGTSPAVVRWPDKEIRRVHYAAEDLDPANPRFMAKVEKRQKPAEIEAAGPPSIAQLLAEVLETEPPRSLVYKMIPYTEFLEIHKRIRLIGERVEDADASAVENVQLLGLLIQTQQRKCSQFVALLQRVVALEEAGRQELGQTPPNTIQLTLETLDAAREQILLPLVAFDQFDPLAERLRLQFIAQSEQHLLQCRKMRDRLAERGLDATKELFEIEAAEAAASRKSAACGLSDLRSLAQELRARRSSDLEKLDVFGFK